LPDLEQDQRVVLSVLSLRMRAGLTPFGGQDEMRAAPSDSPLAGSRRAAAG